MSAVKNHPKEKVEETKTHPQIPIRRRGTSAYLAVTAIAAFTLIIYFGYGWLTKGHVNTDNAQLESDVIPLAAKVGGTILHLHVSDNQKVKKGDLLAELETRDYEIRVAQARADLEAAQAQAESSPSSSKTIHAAQIAAANAALERANAELRKTDADLKRASSLKSQNAIAPVEFENATNAFDKARAASKQATAELKLAEEQHGAGLAKVKSAEAAHNQAVMQLEYTKILAPRDGTLSKLAAQEGQIVQPGQTIALLVATNVFLVANFKETQIGRMQQGQDAEISVDAYPGRTIRGRVESLSAATGARFSLLPPDNASGNFVKVVQRVPVKIALEDAPTDIALKAGLSAEVTVFVK